MPQKRNINIGKNEGRDLILDCFTPETGSNWPVIVFIHGFKGFRNWGPFPLMFNEFNMDGIAMVLPDLSHNGMEGKAGDTFTDLESFGANTITKELQDIEEVVNWTIDKSQHFGWDPKRVYLVGHSRGGADAILHASKDDRIKGVICWAPISNYLGFFNPNEMNSWKSAGKIEIHNGRTGQNMPLNYSFVEDINKHPDFDILVAASKLEIPLLLLHGSADTSVAPAESDLIYDQCLHAVSIQVKGANHTFNTSHPWPQEKTFPKEFKLVIENTIEFIND